MIREHVISIWCEASMRSNQSLANVQAREAVIPVVFGKRLAESLLCEAGHCPAEIWHVVLSEGGAVPRAVKPP